MCSSEVLFRRLLCVSKTRDIDLRRVLEHELAAVPPALFNDDGSMRKTSKSDLSKKLEAICDEIHILPSSSNNTAYLIDGMAMFQSLHESLFKTFDDLSEHYSEEDFETDGECRPEGRCHHSSVRPI